MKWKHWLQVVGALCVGGLLLYVCVLILPAMRTWVPILAWTFGLAIEIVVIGFAITIVCLPFGILFHFRQKGRIALMEAGKLHVTEQGYMQPYISTRQDERLLVPAITAHSPFVPNTVHIEENSSSSSKNTADDWRRQLAERRQNFLEDKYYGQSTEMPPLPARLPDAPSFQDVIPYVKKVWNEQTGEWEDQVVLAYALFGAVLGTVLDWLSTLVVGLPGNGKSTLLYFFIAQLMILKAKFQVLDPAGTLVNLKAVLPYVNRHDACIQIAPKIEQELEDRITRYENNGGKCLDDHYMLIIDELPSIADREQQLTSKMDKRQKAEFRSLIDVVRRVVCEGRKYKMYCVVVGQSIPAYILPTIARDNMSSRYVFYCQDLAARMAGLDKKAIEEYLPLLHGQKGKCVVSPGTMDSFLGAIPLTEMADLQRVIESTGYVRDGFDSFDDRKRETGGNTVVNMEDPLVEPDERYYGNVSRFPKNTDFEPETDKLDLSGNGNAETELPKGITQALLENIAGCLEAGWTMRETAGYVRLTGRNYWKFQAACQYLGISKEVEAQF